MAWKVTVDPAVEPVTLTEAKLQLKVDDTTDNDFITELIKSSRQWCEGFQNRAYIAQTIQMLFDDWPDEIVIPQPPLHAITSIRYKDTAGSWQTLATTVYDTDKTSEPGKVVLAYNQSWPSIRGDTNGIEVNINAGYAATFTANATTNVCTASGRTYADTDCVQLSNLGGALPAGLTAGTAYYIRDVSGYTFKLAATSGGAAIDITGAGTGTHFVGVVPEIARQAIMVIVNHFYEHRQVFSEENLKEIPFSAKSLLSMDRVFPL